MTLLRTPAERFEDLPDYDHEPGYVEVDVEPGTRAGDEEGGV